MRIELLKTKVEEISTPLLAGGDVFLVDILVRREQRTILVQVFVDTDDGVTIDQCAGVSRNLGRAIDQAGIIEGAYKLEVSSPGLDRPLRLLRQFEKNKGRRFRVKINRDGETQVFDADIGSVDGEEITFQKDDGSSEIVLFENVLEAREQLPW